jgi:hypothetical protein
MVHSETQALGINPRILAEMEKRAAHDTKSEAARETGRN